MILLRNLDFESGYSNRESCIVFIDLNDGTVPEFKTATIQVIDLNDNKPYITNPPSQLEYEEVISQLTMAFFKIPNELSQY